MEDLINNMNNLKIKERYKTSIINEKEESVCMTNENTFRYPNNYFPKFCISVKFPKNIIIDLPDNKNMYDKVISNNEILERSKDEVVNEKISTTKKGDIIEDWIYNFLLKSDQLINVTNVGRDNGKLDIIFRVKEEVDQGIIRGIQVKQLTKNNKNSYFISDLKKYDNDTLIVGVSEDRKYMCLIFNTYIRDLDSFSFSINDYKNKKYKQYIFSGLDDNSLGYTFFDELIKCCKKSTIYNDSQFSENNLKENKMMKELEKKCEGHGLSFKPCDTSDSPIDAFINKKRVQCKYSSEIGFNFYDFSLKHTINNKINQPYSENDVDFFIFKHKKEDSFYIIPQNVLLYFGYLTTEEIEGKIGINLAPSSYQEYHWTKQFINRFDLINNEYDLNKLKNLDNPFDKFQDKCKANNIICNRDMKHLLLNNGFVNDKTFKLFSSKTKIKKGKLYQFTTGINTNPYHINNLNIPDFFIFRIEDFPDDFYIIPKNILVEQEIIGFGDKKGKISFRIPEPADITNKKQWIFKHLNNFDLLKDKIELSEEI